MIKQRSASARIMRKVGKMASLKLHAFQSGFIRTKKRLIVQGGGDKSFVVAVPFFLIEHPQGRLLYDCGQPLSAVDDDKKPSLDRDYISIMSESDYAPHQLCKAGIELNSIKYVVVSHMHSDHVGALGSFPEAIHFIQRSELEYGDNKLAIEKFGLKLQVLESEDSYDVFGDGSVKIIFTPGHTPGHQSVLLRFPNGKQTLLAGDSVYIDEILKEEALPGVAWNYDRERMTLNRIRLMRTNGVKVVAGHCAI